MSMSNIKVEKDGSLVINGEVFPLNIKDVHGARVGMEYDGCLRLNNRVYPWCFDQETMDALNELANGS